MKIIILILLFLIADSAKVGSKIKTIINGLVNNIPKEKEKIQLANFNNSRVKTIIDNGYNSFAQNTFVVYFDRVEDEDFRAFLTHLAKIILKVPNGNINDFMLSFDLALFSETTYAINFRLFYSDNKGECNYIYVISDRIEDEATEWIVIKTKVNFQLAPSIFISTNTKTVLWGLYKETNTIIEKLPRSLTMEDLNRLCNFLNIIALEEAAKFINERSLFLEYLS